MPSGSNVHADSWSFDAPLAVLTLLETGPDKIHNDRPGKLAKDVFAWLKLTVSTSTMHNTSQTLPQISLEPIVEHNKAPQTVRSQQATDGKHGGER